MNHLRESPKLKCAARYLHDVGLCRGLIKGPRGAQEKYPCSGPNDEASVCSFHYICNVKYSLFDIF